METIAHSLYMEWTDAMLRDNIAGYEHLIRSVTTMRDHTEDAVTRTQLDEHLAEYATTIHALRAECARRAAARATAA